MKFFISDKSLLKKQKETQKRCIEALGKGKFEVEELEKIVEIIKNTNNQLRLSCKTTIKAKTITCGGTSAEVDISTITQSKLYKENQNLLNALSLNISIAKANNLERVTDFDFTEKQILNYNK